MRSMRRNDKRWQAPPIGVQPPSARLPRQVALVWITLARANGTERASEARAAFAASGFGAQGGMKSARRGAAGPAATEAGGVERAVGPRVTERARRVRGRAYKQERVFGRAGIRKWSGKRDSNPRLRPWQGRTLPLSYSRSPRRSRALYVPAHGCHRRTDRTTALNGQARHTDPRTIGLHIANDRQRIDPRRTPCRDPRRHQRR